MTLQSGLNYLNLLCIYGVHEELQSWILVPHIDPSVDKSLALFFGVENGHFEVVNVLLSDGRVNPNDCNALSRASKKGRLDIVERILEDPRTDPSLDNNAALLSAGHGHYKHILERLLLDPRINVTRDNNRLFIDSCASQYLLLIEYLLAAGRADPATQDNKALKHAIRHHHINVIRTLLADSRIDPNFENQAIFSMAASAVVIQIFLQDPRMTLLPERASIFVQAINNKRSDIVQLLLKDGRINPCAEDLAALVSAVPGWVYPVRGFFCDVQPRAVFPITAQGPELRVLGSSQIASSVPESQPSGVQPKTQTTILV
ncbi:hypothetical protein BCR33DRAFT_739570 [Rhizoclosmatium globosum]|uniref:Ankyrin n=1 Tax=Rhizoclosmatium globosum TaxID=329046 RepID=A0A1Y2C3A6_9FUNG|nr:hypothetical protein BCR33DRAFT_739570 [Rhizoclosmatium globosum]|eukprot:ORY41533.1 hypothetical protein BCR33DRAFT_739570 [Rhizoclosmatium globosum]